MAEWGQGEEPCLTPSPFSWGGGGVLSQPLTPSCGQASPNPLVLPKSHRPTPFHPSLSPRPPCFGIPFPTPSQILSRHYQELNRQPRGQAGRGTGQGRAGGKVCACACVLLWGGVILSSDFLFTWGLSPLAAEQEGRPGREAGRRERSSVQVFHCPSGMKSSEWGQLGRGGRISVSTAVSLQ